MDYRGYHLEQKTLLVGCQITITKDGTFIRNSSVLKDMKAAIAEARAYIDDLLAQWDRATEG